MREFKFRAFDKDHNFMAYIHDFYWFEEEGVTDSSGDGHYANYILMQYTGLKDKNGKEIYEGDIVTNKTKSFSENGFKGKDLIMLVEWYQDECFYSLSVYDQEYWGLKKLTKSSASDIEVIGNIYEHPELINK